MKATIDTLNFRKAKLFKRRESMIVASQRRLTIISLSKINAVADAKRIRHYESGENVHYRCDLASVRYDSLNRAARHA